jgi:hypothetical protein
MITPQDIDAIAAQLGKRPRNVVAVAARCPAGHPCVITTYPLRKIRGRLAPFPTLYWLTCPRLSQSIAHLERDGVIAEAEAELERNPTMREALLRNHRDYIARRWATLTLEDQSLVDAQGMRAEFDSRGIGGMANLASVKCLHLHVAQHLVSENAIGAWLFARYTLHPCSRKPAQQSPGPLAV